MTRPEGEAWRPGVGHLWLAGLRAALVPAVWLGEALVDHPDEHTGAFPFVLAAFALWSAALLALRALAAGGRVRPPPPALDRIEPFVDLVAIAALTYSSGGPFSETAMAFFVLPVLAAARRL
jgi:hypothetical protein